MMRALEFSVIACVFDLNRYASHPQTAAPNLYSLALPRLTSQFCDIIGNRYHGGRIRVEKGRREQDRAIARCWDELRDSGTPQTSAQTIRNRIEFLWPHTKKERLVELELADFVLTPIGRHFADYPDESEWDIVREKFHGGTDSAVTISPNKNEGRRPRWQGPTFAPPNSQWRRNRGLATSPAGPPVPHGSVQSS